MKILALEVERPGARLEQFAPHLRDEAARAYALYEAGILRELHFRADRRSAVLVLECAALADARAALDSLPLVAAGLIEFELIPLAPYGGFARLFAESS